MPIYRFQMVANAFVRGDYRVTADSPEGARRKMLAKLGDTVWSYEGLDDDQPVWVRELSEDDRVIDNDIPDLDPDAKPQPPDPLIRVDWEMLKQQKLSLLKVISHFEEPGYDADDWKQEREHLLGILHLIDALQDYAVEGMGLAENLVFNLSEED